MLCVFDYMNAAWFKSDWWPVWQTEWIHFMVLTQPAARCSYSSCTASSPLPSCTWLCILVPPCGWWTWLPGWSLWSASPPLSDILHTNMQIKLIYNLVRNWFRRRKVVTVNAADGESTHLYVCVQDSTAAAFLFAFAKRKSRFFYFLYRFFSQSECKTLKA